MHRSEPFKAHRPHGDIDTNQDRKEHETLHKADHVVRDRMTGLLEEGSKGDLENIDGKATNEKYSHNRAKELCQSRRQGILAKLAFDTMRNEITEHNQKYVYGIKNDEALKTYFFIIHERFPFLRTLLAQTAIFLKNGPSLPRDVP